MTRSVSFASLAHCDCVCRLGRRAARASPGYRRWSGACSTRWYGVWMTLPDKVTVARFELSYTTRPLERRPTLVCWMRMTVAECTILSRRPETIRFFS